MQKKKQKQKQKKLTLKRIIQLESRHTATMGSTPGGARPKVRPLRPGEERDLTLRERLYREAYEWARKSLGEKHATARQTALACVQDMR